MISKEDNRNHNYNNRFRLKLDEEQLRIVDDRLIKGYYRLKRGTSEVKKPLSTMQEAEEMMLKLLADDESLLKPICIRLPSNGMYRCFVYDKGDQSILGDYGTEQEARQAYVAHMNKRWEEKNNA